MLISNVKADEERAFYASKDATFENCDFSGPADGESALKESRSIKVKNCNFDLRYPFWHVSDCNIEGSKMTENCRAALWYSDKINISDSKLHGIKVLRECKDISVKNSDIRSPECGWFCDNITLHESYAEGEYFLFHSKNITLKNMHFKGKYSFQYCENILIEDSILDTKDAFWESKNITVKNSVVKGEYLAWYSENLTLINCKIIGTQPLCYCKGLRLIDCEMTDCDLSFEYSEVEAEIKGHIHSVKNPLSGRITADSIGEIIIDENSRGVCEINVRKEIK